MHAPYMYMNYSVVLIVFSDEKANVIFFLETFFGFEPQDLDPI